MRFLKQFFEKALKFMCQKLQRFEQSKSKARITTPESYLTASNYMVRNKNFQKKSQQNVTSGKLKRFEHHFWMQDSQPQSTLIAPNYMVLEFQISGKKFDFTGNF